MSSETFTAAEIARCLQCSPQNIRTRLKATRPADDKKIVSGVPTSAWRFDGSLPSPLLANLAKVAQRSGFSTPLQLLQNAPRKSELPSLVHVAEDEIQRAQNLQLALAPCFRLRPEAPIAELARIASPEYARVFGRRVSDRYLRALIKRTIDRDRGQRNFDRLDLYVPRAAKKRISVTSPLNRTFRFEELDSALATIRNRNRPTLLEIDYCWREMLKMIGDRIASGANEIKLKQQLRDYIVSSAPFLGATPGAAKRNLNRKLREAIDGGGIDQIADGRLHPVKRGERGPLIFAADLKLLAQHAVFYCGRRESQAFRQLHEGTTHNGERFSEEFRAACLFNVRTAKSEVPKWVRVAVQPIVRAVWKRRLGESAARLSGPSIHRDWSDVRAGSSYTSDDVTLNHYVIDWHDRGEYDCDGRRFNVVRPQFLPVVDERTGNPLGFSLIPAPTYNAWQIRTLITRICMRQEIGLPFEQFLFERAIWNSRNTEALARWSEIDGSFARNGVQLRVRHATTPKAKVIEQAIGALQNLDEYAPGYIGRGEQRVKYERVQKFLLALKRVGQPQKAEASPTEMLMTMEQCEEMLAAVMKRFADEPQNGDRLQGLSPAEGWAQLSCGRAHVVLPESLRYLLGTAESVQRVTTEGVTLRIGRSKHYYCGSERLGALIGEKVHVRFNPELPEHITVSHVATDPHGLQPFSVPLFEEVRAHAASAEEFAQAREHQNRFVSYGRALYRELVPKTNKTWCNSAIGTQELRTAGESHNRLEREHIELNTQRDAERASIRSLAARQNLAIDPQRVKRPERVRRHLESAERTKARILELEKAGAESQENGS